MFDSKEVQECLAKVLDQALTTNPELAARLQAVKATKGSN